MKRLLVKLGLSAGLALIGTANIVKADGGDSASLVDVLVKKGVLSSQEGIDIRDELLKDYKSTGGGALTFGSKAVKGLKLYGDTRLRYEWDKRTLSGMPGLNTATVSGQSPYTQERNRDRFRVRLGAEYLFTDNFKAGVRLNTNAGGAHNSGNADFGTGTFNWNANNSVFVDLAYIESDKSFGLDWLSWSAGRILQPHNIVNGWTWDSDVNPDGGLIKLGDFKPFGNEFTIGSTHGIYIWGDIGSDNQYGNKQTGSDPWLFVNQLDLAYKFSPSWNLRVSPAFIASTGDSSAQTNANSTAGNGWSNAVGGDINYLNEFLVDVGLDTPFFLSNSKGKFYGEYGVNLTAGEQSWHYVNNATSQRPQDARNQFFLAGYQVSGGGQKGKGKGGWSLDGTYAYYEAYSWSGALIDSDWAAGALNGKGFGLKAAYNFTENITGSVNWRHSDEIDHNIAGVTKVLPTTAGLPVGSTDLIQCDLVWKF